MWAARAAAEHAERTAIHRLNKMIQNNSDESTQHNRIRYDEFFRQMFVENFFPFVIWCLELILSTLVLVVLSVASYLAVYNWVVMRGLEVQSRPIYFDYNPPSPPIGIVDLRSTKRAPWAYSCSCTHDKFCAVDGERTKGTTEASSFNDENKVVKTGCDAEDSFHPILRRDQKYFFEISLTLPESEINKRLGIFMVDIDLLSRDKQLLASSKQSSMLPFESNMVELFRKLSILLPLSTGLLAESRTVTLLSFDNYVDLSAEQSLSYVEVTLGVPKPASFSSSLHSIQIQSSMLRYGKEMSPIQEFFRSMRWPCAFLGTMFFFMIYVYSTLMIIWRRRYARIKLDAQPYADFFSYDGSAPNNSNTEPDRWMGADIEILEEDCDNSGLWEPLNETNQFKINVSRNEDNAAIEQIVSDEEKSTRSVEACTEKGMSQVDHAEKSFPFGKSNLAVKERPNTFRQKPSREDEEKSLADMVMNGYSKYEIFTGERVCTVLVTSHINY